MSFYIAYWENCSFFRIRKRRFVTVYNERANVQNSEPPKRAQRHFCSRAAGVYARATAAPDREKAQMNSIPVIYSCLHG